MPQPPVRPDSPIPGKPIRLPTEYRNNPLIESKVVFTIPDVLLSAIVREVGRESFDPPTLQMEQALSVVCGDHTGQIGFWREQPINFSLLRPNLFTIPEWAKAEHSMYSGRSRTEVDETLTKAKYRVQWARTVQRGYCGWLMTNRHFIDEQLQLLRRWEKEISESGIPVFRSGLKTDDRDGSAELCEQNTESSLGQDFDCFFIRWRLIGIPAPGVPSPLGPQLPVVHIGTILPHLETGGGVFYIPDIFPIPTRDDLREILEEELRFDDLPDHIAEWGELVGAGNKGKNRIERFGRLFEIQHFMRALHARHGAALNRKKAATIVALASFFGVSDDAIESDLREIGDRLGKDWYLPKT